MLRKKISIAIFLLFSIVTSYSQGSGYALDFDGVDDYVSVGNSTILRPTTNITIEAWVKPRTIGSWIAILGNLIDNGSNENGYGFVSNASSGNLMFWVQTIGGTTNNYGSYPQYTPTLNVWQHIAGVYDGATLTMYVNGVALATTLAKTGDIRYTSVPLDFRIGQYYDDDEHHEFNGDIDEVRVWSTARSATEIQANMCKKLTGTETGLLGYWRFDDASGTTLDDLTSNSNDGTLINMIPASDWITSGAAIGDDSSYDYTTPTSVTLESTGRGSFNVGTVTGTPDGVQIYRVDQAPNTSSGISSTLGSNDIYYGVFLAGGTSPSYTSTYTYTGYTAAETDEASILLSTRDNNSSTPWVDLFATVDTGANTIAKSSITEVHKEFVPNKGTSAPEEVAAGHGLDFDGSDDYVALSTTGVNVTAASVGLPSADKITIEAWVKPDAFATYTSVVSFSQDNGATENGIQLGVTSGDRFEFVLAGGGNGLTYLSSTGTYNTGQWYHIAGTYDGTTMTIYVNGVADGTSTAESGNIFYQDSRFRIGKFEDDNEDVEFNGQIDEVRIWDKAKTETEIRTQMCTKLDGTETNLTHYWRFDQTSGTNLIATKGGINGTLTNMDAATDWVLSGAALGDASSYVYPVDPAVWTGETVNLTTTDKGTFEVNGVTGTANGIHVYRVDDVTSSPLGITVPLGSNDIYYGVFVAATTLPTYTTVYNYSNYAAATSSEPNINIYTRLDNSITSWESEFTTPDYVANTETNTANTGVNKEFLLGGISSTITAHGYLGPGGVGHTDGHSTLQLWKDANQAVTGSSPVTAWSEVSGNPITTTIVGDPQLTVSSLNSYPVITFDGTGDRITTDLDINEAHYKKVSIISVYKPRVDNAGAVWGDENGGFDRFLKSTGTNNVEGSNGSSDVARTSAAATGDPVISTVFYDEDTANGASIYTNGNLLGATFTSNHGVATSNDFTIGDIGNNSLNFDGDIAEIIVYSTILNTAQRIIIDNYLSAKYNITLSSNDFYTQDDTGNGNFDHDVAGIGQATDGGDHQNSQGTGIVRMYNPETLANDRFLFWGRNNKTAYTFATNTSNYKERISSVWRINKRNDLGTVTFEIDLTGIDISGKQSCADLELVVDNDSDLLSPTNTYTLSNVSGNIYRADGVTFADNDYFTIEYQDKIVVDGSQFYNGSGASNVPNSSDTCYKLLVKNTASGALTLTENASVREVEVESGGKLAVNTGVSLSVTNSIQLDGEIRLVGTSQLLQTHTGVKQVTGSGSLYTDQTGTATTVYQSGYWSSPVTTNGTTYTISGVMKDGTVATTAIASADAAEDINFIDGHDGSKSTPITISRRWLARLNNATDWTRQISETLATLTPGEGYNMKSTGGGTQRFTFVGSPNDGNYQFTIDTGRLSLLGNPYASALDANDFLTENSGATTGIIYFYDSTNDTSHSRASYTGGYAEYNGTIGTGFSGGTAPQRYIPVGQAFFVTRDAVGTGTINFDNSQREFVPRGGTSVLFTKNREKKATSNITLLRVGFSFAVNESRDYKRQLAIMFQKGYDHNYDLGKDAEMFDRQPSDLALAVQNKTTPFVITAIDEFEDIAEIPLTIFLDRGREVIFTIDKKININSKVYLKDAVEGKFYELIEGGNVKLNLPAGTYNDRFSIVFKDNSTVGVEEFLEGNHTIFYDKESKILNITLKDNTETNQVNLFNILGQKVSYWNVNKTNKLQLNLSKNKLIKGVYIVQLKTNKGIYSKKIIIN